MAGFFVGRVAAVGMKRPIAASFRSLRNLFGIPLAAVHSFASEPTLRSQYSRPDCAKFPALLPSVMHEAIQQELDAARQARDQGQQAIALAHFQCAADLARADHDHSTLAFALRHVADIAAELGQAKIAVEAGSEAVAICRLNPEAELDLANALRVNALALEALGQTGEAVALWREARTGYENLAVFDGVDECNAHLGVEER